MGTADVEGRLAILKSFSLELTLLDGRFSCCWSDIANISREADKVCIALVCTFLSLVVTDLLSTWWSLGVVFPVVSERYRCY